MKKLMFLIAFSLVFSPMLANAETIIVVDQNNVVRQQLYTQPSSTQIIQPQPVYVQPQQVVVQQPPQTVVVRQTAAPRSYYYDPIATGLLVGFTGAVVGHALFGHHHHHGGHHGGHHRHH